MHSNHKQVLIVGGFDRLMVNLFYAHDWRATRDLHQADLVVFTGGEDINPALYSENAIPAVTYFNDQRDLFERQHFDNARNLGVPMVGICRGAQLLNVLNGGRLWQDVDNHTGSHYIVDIESGDQTYVSSTHHQQMRMGKGSILVAKSTQTKRLSSAPSICTYKEAEGVRIVPSTEEDFDPEVVWYPGNRSLCFQPHPEIPNAHSTRKYFWNVVERYLDPIINEGMVA